MKIKKIKLQNFKMHESNEFDFNEDVNIIVGDNECGKSSLLEAIEICLNHTYRGKPLNAELTTDLFNDNAINKYLTGNLAQNSLPEIRIEAYLDGDASLKGTNNLDKDDSEGIYIRVFFDIDLADSYSSITNTPAPSLKTKPSRSASQGRLAACGSSLRVDNARAAAKPPKPTGVVANSAPPTTIASASPY